MGAPGGIPGSESAAALVGLDGFVLLAAVEIDGELWQLVDTMAERAWCRRRCSLAVSKDRRTVKTPGSPRGGRPAVLAWWKRVRRCPAGEGETRTWTEAHRRNGPGGMRVGGSRRITQRPRSPGRPGVGWAAVVDYGTTMLDDPARIGAVVQIGLDDAKLD